MRIALFPGSFDPFHNGHLEVVESASRLFDEVIVAVLRNPQKGEPLFTLEERQEMLEDSIVKGLRAVTDFENEMQMAQMNQQLSGIDTLFIPTASTHSFIASRLLREVARFGGDVTALVPAPVAKRLQERFGP